MAWWCCMGSFERQLSFGQLGEGAISRWLQARGHSVFPAYQMEQSTGKGPQLFSLDGDLVLPDLLAFRANKAQWIEAKRKTCFTWHRNTGRWVTGIDLRHYGEYLEVSARTALPVWLLFYHPESQPSGDDAAHGCPNECPTGLFGNNLAVLAECENHRSSRWGNSGMVYWAHEKLRLLAPVSDLA